MDTVSFPGVKCDRGVLLTTHPLLVPRSWESRAIPLPTLWATPGRACNGITLPFYLFRKLILGLFRNVMLLWGRYYFVKLVPLTSLRTHFAVRWYIHRSVLNRRAFCLVLYFVIFIHSAFCLTTGPQTRPKPVLRTMRSRASSFKFQFPLLSFRSSSRCLCLLLRLPHTSILLYIFSLTNVF